MVTKHSESHLTLMKALEAYNLLFMKNIRFINRNGELCEGLVDDIVIDKMTYIAFYISTKEGRRKFRLQNYSGSIIIDSEFSEPISSEHFFSLVDQAGIHFVKSLRASLAFLGKDIEPSFIK